MYGIHQAVLIAYDALVKHLYTYGYHLSSKTPRLRTHNNLPINFTLVVDDLGVKYSVKENVLYLIAALEYKYKVTTDWERKLYTL